MIKYIYYNLKFIIFGFYGYKKNIYNNKNYIIQLKNIIDNCGCITIKFIQWILPIIHTIYGPNNLYNELLSYLDNCNIHELDYTKNIFKKDFNYNIDDKYIIKEVIASGSIGQVYIIKDKIYNTELCMKVIHPNLYKQYYSFYMIY